jgi:hypothetical protein
MARSRYFAINALVPGLQKRFIGVTSTDGALSEAQLKAVALERFLEDNKRCGEYNKNFETMKWGPFQALAHGEISKKLYSVLQKYGTCKILYLMSRGFITGPGASSGVKSQGLYEKLFDGPLTFGSLKALRLYKLLISTTGALWSYSEYLRHFNFGGSDLLAVAQFTSVPQTNEKNRGICTQPLANMVGQLGLHFALCRILKAEFDCALDEQQFLNRELAKFGSVGPSVSRYDNFVFEFVTVDMSRASNFPWSIICSLFDSTALLSFLKSYGHLL